MEKKEKRKERRSSKPSSIYKSGIDKDVLFDNGDREGWSATQRAVSRYIHPIRESTQYYQQE